MKIKIWIFIFLSLNVTLMAQNYKVLDWHSASKILEKHDVNFKDALEIPSGCVYNLKDSTFLVMPNLPSGKCLITKDEKTLNEWLSSGIFPINEDNNSFFVKNKANIENLMAKREELKREILDFTGFDKSNLSESIIDSIYNQLNERNSFQQFEFNFILLVGEYLLESEIGKDLTWGVLEQNLFLNPSKKLVLIDNSETQLKYFKLEDSVIGKWGYNGFKFISNSFKSTIITPNEFEYLRVLCD